MLRHFEALASTSTVQRHAPLSDLAGSSAKGAFLAPQGSRERQQGSQQRSLRRRVCGFESPAEAAAGFTRTATDKNLSTL
jgi:hypothetical protein